MVGQNFKSLILKIPKRYYILGWREYYLFDVWQLSYLWFALMSFLMGHG